MKAIFKRTFAATVAAGITAVAVVLPVSAEFSADELQAVQDEMFVYVLQREGASRLGAIEENPMVSFTYNQLGLFLQQYDGYARPNVGNGTKDLYNSFVNWQVYDSEYKNFYPEDTGDGMIFTDGVTTYKFTDAGTHFIMNASDGSLIGTYDKLYQFAYLNESEAVTTTQRVFTTTIDVYGSDSSAGVCTVADGTQDAVLYSESDGSVTTVSAEPAPESVSETSVGTYVTIAGGILVVGGCVIAVAANKRKK